MVAVFWYHGRCSWFRRSKCTDQSQWTFCLVPVSALSTGALFSMRDFRLGCGSALLTVFYRNVSGLTDEAEYLLPYWLNYLGGEENFNKSQCLCAGANNWAPTQEAMNGGLMDKWALIDDPQSWGYFKRQDIPYHYALADAYTVGDAYHVSSSMLPS